MHNDAICMHVVDINIKEVMCTRWPKNKWAIPLHQSSLHIKKPNTNVNERQLKIKILKLQIKMNATETITILSVVVKILCSNILKAGDVWTVLVVVTVLLLFFVFIFLLLLQYVASMTTSIFFSLSYPWLFCSMLSISTMFLMINRLSY